MPNLLQDGETDSEGVSAYPQHGDFHLSQDSSALFEEQGCVSFVLVLPVPWNSTQDIEGAQGCP